MEKEKLSNLNSMLENYFNDNRSALKKNLSVLEGHLGKDIMESLKSFFP
jgi:hypothetical protein